MGEFGSQVSDGISVIDPHNLHENKLPPPVHIEQVTADDKTYHVGERHAATAASP